MGEAEATSNSGLSPMGRLLYPLLGHPRAKQTLKWIVYSALVVNSFLYLQDDIEAFVGALPDNAGLIDILFQFSTTIDTIAWLGLVFLFELETYVISDAGWTPWAKRCVHGTRLLCYALIAFAAIGYTAESLETFDPRPLAGVDDLCELADSGVYAQTRADAYPEITAGSCAALSTGAPYYTLSSEEAVVAAGSLPHLQFLGIMDIENAYIWIIVVLLIELEVWMQNNDRFGSRSLRVSRRFKAGFYAVLIANGIVWFYYDYLLYAWDAFLWIFGFWAIELNLAEWEEERREEIGDDATAIA